MEEMIKEALVRKARSILRSYQASVATSRKYATRYAKRTGKTPGKPKAIQPTIWNIHKQFDPIYCIKHANYLSKVIWKKIQSGEYTPIPAVQYEIKKSNGGIREIMAFAIPDSAVATVIHQAATTRNINILSANSYAYRPDKSIFDAIIKLRRAVSDAKVYVVQYDFSKYFDTIDHRFLEKTINDRRSFVLSTAERTVMRSFLVHSFSPYKEYNSKDAKRIRSKGVPQGSSLSLFLSNAAGHALDLSLERMNGSFVRYADDVVAITHSYSDALKVAQEFRDHCAAAGLKINREKSPGIRILAGTQELERREMGIDFDDIAKLESVEYIDYLGHRLRHDGVELPDRSIQRIKKRISSIIHKHLFLYSRGNDGSMAHDRVGIGYFDWDLVTCLNEIRKYIYGGLGETQIRRFLEDNIKPPGIRGLMGFMPLITIRGKLAALDGWLINALQRAQTERCKVAAKHGFSLKKLSKKTEIVDGSWYKFPSIVQATTAPSFIRAWRASRKYYLRYGLVGIEPPKYYSMIEYN